MKPDVFVARSSRLSLAPGSDLRLECSVNQESDHEDDGEASAKRLWRHDGEIVAHGTSAKGRRTVRDRGKVLRVEGVRPGDGGVYTCAAVTKHGQDIVQYTVEVSNHFFSAKCTAQILNYSSYLYLHYNSQFFIAGFMEE